MAVKGLTLSKEEVSQEIDLESLTGVDVSQDPDLLQEIAQAVIDYTKERTASQLGVGRKALPSPYSESYSESLDFKAAGKSKNNVNLKLSGEMLDAIDVLEIDGSKLKYGISDQEQAIKAFGHQTGFEGHPTIKGVKKREFVGVTQAEFEKYVLPKFKKDLQQIEQRQESPVDVIGQIRNASDLFGVSPSLDNLLFRDLLKISQGDT